MAKRPSSEFEAVVNRLLRTPHKAQADSKIGKQPKGKPVRRTAGKGRARVGKAKD